MKKIPPIYAIIIYFLLVGSLFFPSLEEQPSPLDIPVSNEIRVMTFNARYGIETGEGYDIPAFVKVIEETKPQVIGFQEVTVNIPNNGFINMYEDLRTRLKELGYDHSYLSEGGTRILRNAMFSQYEITNVKTIALEPVATYERDLIVAEIDVNGILANVLVTHLTNIESGFQDTHPSRVQQVQQIIDELNKLEIKNTILMGDLNSYPTYPEIALIETILIDGWNATYPNEDGYTSPSNNPYQRIDYIFLSDDIEIDDCTVVQTQVSDHLPLYCDISLT